MNQYSFVIPAYNCKKLLKNTLKALNYLLTEDALGYEVIVVDDGSTDDTSGYIKELSLKYNMEYLYLERVNNSSRARARNAGIKAAKGNIIVFIDADIIVRPGYLLELEKFFKVSQDIAVAGLRRLINEAIEESIINDRSIFEEKTWKQLDTGIDFRQAIFEDLSYNAGGMKAPFLYALTCNLAVPKKWIDLTTGFDEELIKWGIEDIEFVYRMYRKGMKIAINSRDYVFHQYHGMPETTHINKKYEEDVKYNTNIFLKKHTSFLGLPKEKIYSLFQSIATEYKEIEKDNLEENILITVTPKDNLEEIKKHVKSLATEKKAIIKIMDYVNDSDLYIWIQLLEKCMAKIKYYPCKELILIP